MIIKIPFQPPHSIPLSILLNHILLLTLLLYNLAVSLTNTLETLLPLYHASLTPLSPSPLPNSCNGHPSLCARSYSNITQIGTHGSAFVGILPTDNQNIPVTTQLDAGVRFLQVQTRADASGRLSACHTNCGLKYAGPLERYLRVVKNWMDQHPREVVTILLTNPDGMPIHTFEKAFNASGSSISSYAYTPLPSHSPKRVDTWPTLQTLIENDTRLVVFMDSFTNTTLVPYILSEYIYLWETPYGVTTPEAFRSCEIDRPKGVRGNDTQAGEMMYIINHFLDKKFFGMDVPDKSAARITNSAEGRGSLGEQMSVCKGRWGRRPKVVLADWVDVGKTLAWEKAINGIG